MTDARPRPLQDVTVLDLTSALAGPFATLLLGGLGARVIKIENPRGGDSMRTQPPYLGSQGPTLERRAADDVSVPFLNRARNKQSITLNLKHDEGRRLFADLVEHADVIVENFSAGTADRLGVGYSDVRSVNPAIIYCSISGFGGSGADAYGKAYDAIIQALSGVMMVSGNPTDEPIRIGWPVADLTAPLFGVIGILSALNQRHRTGVGQHIDISMFGALTSLVACEPFELLEQVGIPTRTGRSVPRLAPFGVFPAADGYVAICAPTDTFSRHLLEECVGQDAADDPRFRDRDSRVANEQALNDLISAWSGQHPAAHVVERLSERGVPVARVRGPAEAVRDPLLVQRGETTALLHPHLDAPIDVQGSGIPIVFSESEAGFDIAPPLLGQHNGAVYGDLLGLPEDDLARLRDDGVI